MKRHLRPSIQKLLEVYFLISLIVVASLSDIHNILGLFIVLSLLVTMLSSFYILYKYGIYKQ